MKTPSAYSLNQEDWLHLLLSKGGSKHLLSFWLDGLYKDRSIWERHISPRLIEEFQQKMNFTLPKISAIQVAQDGTVKFLIQFEDSLEVETVLIPFHKRYTVCLSSQVGCGMNCSFCYTGTQGLKRNLSSGEIIGQYLVARNWLKEKNSKALDPSIVFMGQGEPLHNFPEIKKAISIFSDPRILGVGPKQMTLSTVGYLPGLKLFDTLGGINLALSLHSPFDSERKVLIPINERWPLHEVMPELDRITFGNKRIITYEYLLIKDFNMSDEHVEGLHKLLGNRSAILNLIPFNPFPGSNWKRPEVPDIDAFKDKLVAKKLRVMIRTTKGSDILAACGQLKVNKLARNHGTP